jgi:enamine deaminase RidA (YjgF/YER057c/UK114 family)
MGSWGATTTDESKPKYLTDADKRDVYATDQGWTVAPNVSAARIAAGADREVLVAIRGLSGETKLGDASVSSFNWNVSTFVCSTGLPDISITCNFNEIVTVTGTPRLTVTNTPGTNFDLNYESGTGTNRLVFTSGTMGAEPETPVADDVLSIGVDALTNHGTIKDTASNTNATLENILAVGTAAGSITAVE